MARLIQVIESITRDGFGRDDSDPVRNVVEYYTTDGQLLAWNDPCAPTFDRVTKEWVIPNGAKYRVDGITLNETETAIVNALRTIAETESEASVAFQNVSTRDELEKARVKYVGANGLIKSLFKHATPDVRDAYLRMRSRVDESFDRATKRVMEIEAQGL